jgi:hypothetical protein
MRIPRQGKGYLTRLEARLVETQAMAAYNPSMDYDADDFELPPEINIDLPPVPTRLQQSLPITTGRATSPIQIDEEVVIKNKRKPRVKLIDRYPWRYSR